MDETSPQPEEEAPPPIPVVGIPEVVLLFRERYNRLLIEDKGEEVFITASHNLNRVPEKPMVIKAKYDDILQRLTIALKNGGWETSPYARGKQELGLRATRK